MPTETYTTSFYQQMRSGSQRSAEVIAPLAFDLIHPRSIVDVGCGDGTWLAVFRKLGASEILGVDGDYVQHELLQIPRESFVAADLSKPFHLGRRFDLAVSLEVAEHLPADSAACFVESLTRLSPVVLFSAAIPLQGGSHHVNEQWPDNWAALFGEHNYFAVDCLRKRVWQNDSVEWWYAQNTLLFVSKETLEANSALKAEYQHTNLGQLRLVHPRNYLEAFIPLEVPPWGVRAASALLVTCLKSAAARKLYSIIGKKVPANLSQNPPNYNSTLQHPAVCALPKRGNQ